MEYTDRERAHRFQEARETFNKNDYETKAAVANAIKVSPSMITDAEDEDSTRSINITALRAFAEHYGVSADYLLGLRDDPTNSIEEQSISDITGLRQSSISNILFIFRMAQSDSNSIYSNALKLLNDILGNEQLIEILLEMLSIKEKIQNITNELDSLDPPSVDYPQKYIDILKVHELKDKVDYQKYKMMMILQKPISEICGLNKFSSLSDLYSISNCNSKEDE